VGKIKFKKMKKAIPNALTLCNLLLGFTSCVFAAQGMIEVASLLILGGMIFDFLDGFAARLLKAYSDIGKELDSLADIVTFGVAPGLILLSLFPENSLNQYIPIVIAGFIPMASALRLAKFNTDTDQKTSFKGMPTPASALTIVGLVISGVYGKYPFVSEIMHNKLFLIFLSLFLSVMMLLNVRMISLKFTETKFRGNEIRFIFLAISFLAIGLMRADSILVIMSAYIVLSFLSIFMRPANQ